MSAIITGNAKLDSADTRGWLIGNFTPDELGLRHTDDIEIKWGEHAAGEAREAWVTGETRTAISILVSGEFTVEFRDQTASLIKPGDYVMWGPGTEHKWRAAKDSVVLTVRWPSVAASPQAVSNSQLELELTYLAREIPKEIANQTGHQLTDVYIPDTTGTHPHLRLRQKGDRYEITKKVPVSEGDASVQRETTIPLSKEEFQAMAPSSTKKVSKIRYEVVIDGYAAEVDVFQNDLHGLVIIDFEFSSQEQKSQFVAPRVCLAEVTQEDFVAGGLLADKTYSDIESELSRYNYRKLG